MVIALAGRRIDAADADVSRFPLANIERVRQDLCDLFRKLRPEALVSSGACGGDLLALQVADELGIRRRLILPFDSEQFLETSVTDRPGAWAPLYRNAVMSARANGDLVTVGSYTQDDHAYSLTNRAILDQAAELSQSFDRKVTAVLVWDDRSRGEDDLTDAFRAEAERRGFPVETVRTD